MGSRRNEGGRSSTAKREHCVESLNALSAPWRMDAFFAMIMVFATVSGKVISAALSPAKRGERVLFLLIAPAISIETWRRSRAISVHDLRRLTLVAIATFLPLVAFYAYLRPLISRPEVPWLIRSYLCIVPYLLFTTAIGTTAQILFAAFGVHVQALHERPWRSQTVGEFWGRRWNCVVGDWLRQVCFNPFRRRPRTAILLAFTVSGIMHECFLNLPLYFGYGVGVIGSMALYFAIQTVGVFAERAWLRRSPLLGRAFSWCVVLLPAPMVLNEGMLRLFQFVG